MKIGYVCTNYNNSEFTLEAVRTLVVDKNHEYRIVVVDNQSDERNVATLRGIDKKYPTVHLILNERNLGYFGGLNKGIRYLREHDPDIAWIIVGNNDLEFPPDFPDKLAANARNFSKHAVISPDVVTVDGEHQNPHVIRNISTVREVFYDLYYSNYYFGMLLYKLAMKLPVLSARHDERQWQHAQPIYQGHGSCYLLGPLFFEHFAELWAPTFLMSEEFFLSKQLSDVGLQVYYDPAIRVIHHWHASLAKVPSRQRWVFARDAHREYRKYVKVFRWQ